MELTRRRSVDSKASHLSVLQAEGQCKWKVLPRTLQENLESQSLKKQLGSDKVMEGLHVPIASRALLHEKGLGQTQSLGCER
jgi:hypothetical protein